MFSGPERLVYYREASAGLSKLAYFWALDTWGHVGKYFQRNWPLHTRMLAAQFLTKPRAIWIVVSKSRHELICTHCYHNAQCNTAQ